jgi:hypothetical protein
MASTLVKTEIVYNTRDNSKTTTSTYESFDGYGTEVDGKANRKFSHENGVYRYSGEDVEYFEGVGQSSGGGTSDIYSVEISTGSEPIETHPRYAGLSDDFWRNWEIWKSDKTSDLLKTANLPSGSEIYVTKGYWDPFTYSAETPAGELVQKWKKGIREYLAPKVVSRYQTSGSPSNLSAVGYIEIPPYTAGITGRNWLFTGASSRFNVATGVFETTYEWLASGPKQWDQDLYT